jgi:hypothetical protein
MNLTAPKLRNLLKTWGDKVKVELYRVPGEPPWSGPRQYLQITEGHQGMDIRVELPWQSEKQAALKELLEVIPDGAALTRPPQLEKIADAPAPAFSWLNLATAPLKMERTKLSALAYYQLASGAQVYMTTDTHRLHAAWQGDLLPAGDHAAWQAAPPAHALIWNDALAQWALVIGDTRGDVEFCRVGEDAYGFHHPHLGTVWSQDLGEGFPTNALQFAFIDRYPQFNGEVVGGEMQYTVACPEAAITVSREALVEAVGWVGRTAEDEGRIRIKQRQGYLLIEVVHPGGGRAWRKVACQGDGEVNFTSDWRYLLDALDMPKPLDEVVNLRVAGHHLSMLVVDSKPG